MTWEDGTLEDDDYMLATIGSGKTEKIYVSDTTTATVDDKEMHIFTVNLNSKQMAETVTVTMVVDGTEASITRSTSLRAYCDLLLADESCLDVHALVKAMLNYGGYAQKAFDGATTGLANKGLFTDEVDPVASYAFGTIPDSLSATKKDEACGITLKQMAMVLDTTTAYRFYFEVEDGVEFDSFTFSGVQKTGYDKSSGLYYVQTTGVAPSALLNYKYVTVYNSEGTSVYSVYCNMYAYMSRVYASETIDSIWQDVMDAMYYYASYAQSANRSGIGSIQEPIQ